MIDNTQTSLPTSRPLDSIASLIKFLMQCIENNDVEKIKEKLNERTLASGTLNNLLNKAFQAFRQGSPNSREIIKVLLS
jgi:hypothetical protein